MDIVKAYLKGFGQVMLQENAATGAFFLAGIFYNSWQMGIGAVIGNLVAMLSALFFKYNKSDIWKGLYGANSVLVGIAIVFFLGLNWISIITLIVGSILSAFLSKALSGRKFSGYTAPFIISTWLLLALVWIINVYHPSTSSVLANETIDTVSFFFKSFGQVMFQGNIITGVLFLLGLVVSSRRVAIFSTVGVVVASFFAIATSLPMSSLNLGLFGFNAVLCSIALSNKKWHLGFLAVLLSVLLFVFFGKISVPALTAPFVLATWAVLFIEDKFSVKKI